jgi:hypothetical protein
MIDLAAPDLSGSRLLQFAADHARFGHWRLEAALSALQRLD